MAGRAAGGVVAARVRARDRPRPAGEPVRVERWHLPAERGAVRGSLGAAPGDDLPRRPGLVGVPQPRLGVGRRLDRIGPRLPALLSERAVTETETLSRS